MSIESELILRLRHELAVARAAAQRGDCSFGETGGIHCPLGDPCLDVGWSKRKTIAERQVA
jgi:hypothetical protein